MSAVQSAAPRDRVAVCVCTYRRREGLARLLDALAAQRYQRMPAPLLSVVVADNAGEPDVASLCRERGAAFDALRYVHEPRRGISHARNTCLASVPDATGFIAMIDDDEIPAPDWLEQLLLAQRASGADIIIGPVAPVFDPGTPAWVARSGFFNKPREQDALADLQADPPGATCNALISAACLAGSAVRFHPRLALSGGEDALFFRELGHAGCTIAWAAGARVSETIPPHKATLSYMLREEFRRGNVRILLDRFMAQKAGGVRRRPLGRLREGRRAAKRVAAGLAGLLAALAQGRAERHRLAMHATRIARGLGMLSGLMGLRNEHYR